MATWVETVQRTTTAALINAVEKDIIGFCPELVDFVHARQLSCSSFRVPRRRCHSGSNL
jgi:hypothetical protein